MMRHIAKGVAAGAPGTVALNVATYLDMALRGRGSSSAPAQTAGTLADKAGVELAEEGPESATAENRRSGLGALMGYVTGLGVGAAYGALRAATGAVPLPAAAAGLTVAATVGSAGPMTLLGITDPRQWDAQSWVMDIVPHLAYGVVTAVVYDRLMTD
jgi:hypothetical protein